MSDATWNSLFTLAPYAIAAIGGYLVFRSWRAQKRITPYVDPDYLRINALSRVEAEREARELLESSTPFESAREPLLARDRSLLQELPGDIASFFSSWSDVQGRDMRLARSEIGPYPGDPAFIRIGADIGNDDIIVRRSDGHVFVADSGTGKPSDEGYPSIWHYLLEVASDSNS